MKPLLIRLSASDRHGAACCPDLFCARRVRSVDVIVTGTPSDDELRATERLRRTVALVLQCRGRAIQAALVELLGREAEVRCAGDGAEVDVESLAARLRAGAVWS